MNFGATPERDAQLRQLATLFAKQIIHALEASGAYDAALKEKKQKGHPVVLFHDFEIPDYIRKTIRTRSTRKIHVRLFDGDFFQGGSDGGFHDEKQRFVITAKLRPFKPLDTVLNTLTHELTHLIDYLRIGARNYPENSKDPQQRGDPVYYFNNPIEYNAWFQEGVARLEKLFAIWGKEHGYGDTFDSFENFYEVATSIRSLQHLNERLVGEYRKKFLARMYQLYVAMKERYGD